MSQLVAARPPSREPRQRSESSWLPSEAVLGICMLVLGLALATLILTGVLKLGVGP